MAISYKFITDGENKKVSFTDDAGTELCSVSYNTDVPFTDFVKYLARQIDTEQAIECTYVVDPAHALGDKENLIKQTIDNIVAKYNEVVRQSAVVSDTDYAPASGDDIPF